MLGAKLLLYTITTIKYYYDYVFYKATKNTQHTHTC